MITVNTTGVDFAKLAEESRKSQVPLNWVLLFSRHAAASTRGGSQSR